MPGGHKTDARMGFGPPFSHRIPHDGGWHIGKFDLQPSDALREWECLDLSQNGFEDRIAVYAEMQETFESICYHDRLFAKSLGMMLS